MYHYYCMNVPPGRKQNAWRKDLHKRITQTSSPKQNGSYAATYLPSHTPST